MAEEQLTAALTKWGVDGYPRIRLSGDVSPRSYYRLQHPDGATSVAMVTPLERAAQMRDWLAVRTWLEDRRVPVPTVIHEDPETCVALIEDVGDRLLSRVDDPVEADKWYVDTLANCARLERIAVNEPATTSPAHARCLTEERIHWELRRFRKVVAAVIAELTPAELERWKTGEDQVANAVLTAPYVWMHRDLHARNLLIHREQAVWIDFQDAMRGPWLYDLVSLLYDPYAGLDEARCARLRAAYLAQPNRVCADASESDVENLWWVAAVQRLVHCVACYVWVADHVGNPAYLRYLPGAIARLREGFEHCAQAAPLADIMDSRWDGVVQHWGRYVAE